MVGSFNLCLFVGLATLEKKTEQLSNEKTEETGKGLLMALQNCKWVGDQNYAGEFFYDIEDQQPVVHIDRQKGITYPGFGVYYGNVP
jgi:hypothetical protein